MGNDKSGSLPPASVDEDDFRTSKTGHLSAWVALGLPLIGLLVLTTFLVFAFIAFVSLGDGSDETSVRKKSRILVAVENRCSSAIQLGWFLSDTAVPFGRSEFQSFFEQAIYVDGELWPEVDPYALYSNQSPVLLPGQAMSLEIPSGGLSRVDSGEPKRDNQRAEREPAPLFYVVMRVFRPNDGTGGGKPAAFQQYAYLLRGRPAKITVASKPTDDSADSDCGVFAEGKPLDLIPELA
jgi:hypothetical protein